MTAAGAINDMPLGMAREVRASCLADAGMRFTPR